MSVSPFKLNSSTSYKTSRTPNLSLLKRQIQQFNLEPHHSFKKGHHRNHTNLSVQDLEKRGQIVFKQNSHLLQQNAELSQLLARKMQQIQLLKHRLTQQMIVSPFIDSQEAFISELKLRQEKHINQIKYLLQKIDSLYEQYGDLQQIKKIEIQAIKKEYSTQNLTQIESLRRSQTSNIEIYQKQVKKLKNELKTSEQKQSKTVRELQIQVRRLSLSIAQLNNKNKHLTQLKQLEIQSLKRSHQSEFDTLKRELSIIKDLKENTGDTNLQRVKKQLVDKCLEIQGLNLKLMISNDQLQQSAIQLNQHKTRIQIQNQLLQEKYQKNMENLKSRLSQCNKKQMENLENIHRQFIQSMQAQIKKLYQVNEYKSKQIKILLEKYQIQNSNRLQQKTKQKIQNQYLRKQISQIELSHKTETETLKIKISQLHYSQVKHLQDYLQNQSSVLSEQILSQQKTIDSNRQKLHNEIKNKDQLRKYYQTELSKEKAKVIDLKIKLAAVSIEMKEQIVSLTSRIELTSQTLIRETNLKQKTQIFSQQQKRKLQSLINSKDKQILLLNQQLNGLKKDHIIQSTNLEDYIRQLKGVNEELLANIKIEKELHQNQLKKKESILNVQIQNLKSQIINIKKVQYEKVKEEIETLQKQNIKITKELENLNRDHLLKLEELNLQKGNFESMQLQSSAALEDQKNKYHVLINKNQIALKDFFQQKLAMKNKQIQNLKSQLAEKETDLRDIIAKYKELQRKLSLALQSIGKLTDLENRVMNLGMDNNLIKNLGELFKGNTKNKS